MVPGRTHAVDELAVVGQQQQACGVLVEPADGLHALHGALLRPLAQRRGQQGVDARPGGRFLRAFGARGLVQHDVGALVVVPRLALDRETQALRLDVQRRVQHHLTVDRHQPMLDEPRAHAAGAEALRIEDVLELHRASIANRRGSARISRQAPPARSPIRAVSPARR
jgi:hypothetical protein